MRRVVRDPRRGDGGGLTALRQDGGLSAGARIPYIIVCLVPDKW